MSDFGKGWPWDWTYLDRSGGSVASGQQRSCHGSHFWDLSGVDYEPNCASPSSLSTPDEALLRPETRETTSSECGILGRTHHPSRPFSRWPANSRFALLRNCALAKEKMVERHKVVVVRVESCCV